MKRYLLVSLLMFGVSLLDAMTNPAVMLQASALLRRNLQIVDADATIEHRADGTFVHYLRNGQEMVVFNADLLNKSGTIADMFEDIGSSDQILVAIVKQLFDKLVSIEQIKLAIQALDANNPSLEQDGVVIIADSVKQFVDQLQLKDLAWLANWTDEWQINFVYDALAAKIGSDINVAFDFYNRGLIKETIARDVSDQVDMNSIYDVILKRLFRDITPQLTLQPDERIMSARFNSDGSNILVATSKKIMIYDLHNNLIRSIMSNYYGSAIYSPDESQILVTTTDSVKIYDLQGNLITLIDPRLRQGWIWGNVRYSPDRLQIIVTTNEKVMIYDFQGNLTRSITPLLNGNEYITDSSYSPDGKFILIATTERVMIYDLQGNLIRLIIPQLQEQFRRREQMGLVTFSPDGESILITTTKSVMIYDLQGNLIRLIIPQLQEQQYEFIRKTHYSPDGTHIFIKTSKEREMDYDLEGKLLKILPWIEEDKYSPDGAHILHEKSWGLFIYPNVNLADLDLAQKLLLFKASEAWKVKKAYNLIDKEFEIYRSLPKVLKNKKLFEIEWSEEGLLCGE